MAYMYCIYGGEGFLDLGELTVCVIRILLFSRWMGLYPLYGGKGAYSHGGFTVGFCGIPY